VGSPVIITPGFVPSNWGQSGCVQHARDRNESSPTKVESQCRTFASDLDPRFYRAEGITAHGYIPAKSVNALLWWSLPGANRGARIKVTKLRRQRPSQQSSQGKPVKPLGTLPLRALLFGEPHPARRPPVKSARRWKSELPSFTRSPLCFHSTSNACLHQTHPTPTPAS